MPDLVTVPTDADKVTVLPALASDQVPELAAVAPSFTVTLALAVAITGAAFAGGAAAYVAR